MPIELRMARKGSIMAVHGATWHFNPETPRETFQEAFELDPIGSAKDFGADPPETVTAATHDPGAIERYYDTTLLHPVTEDGGFAEWFVGNPMAEYYLHGDLSLRRDTTGLALVHFDVETGKVVADLLMTIVPTELWKLSFERIIHIVMALISRNFRLVKVTFDGWQSYSTIERIANHRYPDGSGIESHVYSVDRNTEAYDTFFNLLHTGKLRYPENKTLFREIKNLKLLDGKRYDHPVITPEGLVGTKDLSDAFAGAATQCVKSRIGMSIAQIDLESIAHEEHILSLQSRVTDTGAAIWELLDQRVDPHERQRVRTVRIDTAGDDILFVLGWYWPADDRHYVDEFLLWERFDESAMEAFRVFLNDVLMAVKVQAFSLGGSVPLEIVTAVQRTGRPMSTPLNVRVPGQHRHVAQAGVGGPIDIKIVRTCLEHVKRKQVSLPKVLPLFKDIRHSTDETLHQRPYLCCFAAWWEFSAKEVQFGRAGRTMPRPVSMGVSAPVTPAAHRHVAPNGDALAQMRQTVQRDNAGITSRATPLDTGPSKTLPRSRRL